MAKIRTTRKPNLDSLRLQLGYQRGLPVDRVGNDRALIEKYENKFVRSDGKGKMIDERTGKVYNKESALKYINYWKYGTETPDALYNVLNKEAQINKKEKTGPWNLRRLLSNKGVGGKKVVDLEHEAWLEREREKLTKLKSKGNIDEGEGKGLRLKRDEKEAEELQLGAEERGETQWGPGGQPTSANQYAAAGIDLNNLNVGNVLGNSKVTIEGNNNNTEGTTYEQPLSDPDYNPEATNANKNKAKLTLGGQSMRTLEERTKAIERAYGPMSKEAKRKLRLRPITQLELEAM